MNATKNAWAPLPHSLDTILNGYGSVIHEVNPDSEKKLYVVGQRHRRKVGYHLLTPVIQLEMYRILESLHSAGLIGGVFVEGYTVGKTFNLKDMRGELLQKYPSIALSQSISDEEVLSTFISTDMYVGASSLLSLREGIDLHGCETEGACQQSRECHDFISKEFQVITPPEHNQHERTRYLRANKKYLELRSAEILKNSLRFEGSSRNALIIGLLHIPDIVRFSSGKMEVPAVAGFPGLEYSMNEPCPEGNIITIAPRTALKEDLIL